MRIITLIVWSCLFSLAVGSQSRAESGSVSFESEGLWKDTETLIIPGELSKPKGKRPFPAIVLLPNCGGPKTHEFSKFWPKFLNDLGYVTLNVDHFTPRKGKKCTKSFRPTLKTITQDAYGALTYLAGLPEVDRKRIGVLGSSLGAVAINWFAGQGKSTYQGLSFGAAVSLYPSNCEKVLEKADMISTNIILGDMEEGVASCKRLTRGQRVVVNVLPGVYHGFDQPTATKNNNGSLRQDISGNKLLYSKSATKTAQSLVAQFLSTNLAATSDGAVSAGTSSIKLSKVGGKDPYKAVRRRDIDTDGRVSRSEWEKSAALFAKIDADGDGFLTPQEFHDRWKRLQ
jgi:dienelactone hydrolase